MTDFYNKTLIKRSVRLCKCFQCDTNIECGSQKFKIASVYEGEFFAYSTHVECEEAWRTYHKYIISYDCEWIPLKEAEGLLEDTWLEEKFPIVASRLRGHHDKV